MRARRPVVSGLWFGGALGSSRPGTRTSGVPKRRGAFVTAPGASTEAIEKFTRRVRSRVDPAPLARALALSPSLRESPAKLGRRWRLPRHPKKDWEGEGEDAELARRPSPRREHRSRPRAGGPAHGPHAPPARDLRVRARVRARARLLAEPRGDRLALRAPLRRHRPQARAAPRREGPAPEGVEPVALGRARGRRHGGRRRGGRPPAPRRRRRGAPDRGDRGRRPGGRAGRHGGPP